MEKVLGYVAKGKEEGAVLHCTYPQVLCVY
jgi:hypothetical protein